ncbi:MAG TPA: DNA polymerase III subunit delta [Tepidisphaeraceae bacterium]|jgi:DNA polymerase-3 subunit delta|nr:DNA polymerase III subunit delta [Tepidisphaeraceae bacterium]
MAKPVYALVGEDSYLQLQQLATLAAEFADDAQRIDVDGERAELAEVFDELRSFAMFGGSKIVVMRNADAFITRFREQLEDYLAAPSNSATLVLRVASLPSNQRIYKAIAKVGQVIQCAPPKDRELPRWIVDHAKRAHKVTVSQDAALLLADLIGCDLGRLDSELGKLALMTDDARIDAKDVTGSVSFQREQEMWDMTNALAAGDASDALRRWRQLVQLDPSTEFRAVTWLAMWLEEVGLILSGASTAKLQWKYRDRLPKVIQTAKALGKKQHGRAVDLLAEIDKRSKSGVGDAAQNVEQFILSFAR